MWSGVGTLERSRPFCQPYHVTAYYILEHFFRRNGNLCSHQNLYMPIHSSIICRRLKRKTTRMSFKKWIVAQTVVHLYYELRLSSSEEWTVDTWNTLDESQGNYAKWKAHLRKLPTIRFCFYIMLEITDLQEREQISLLYYQTRGLQDVIVRGNEVKGIWKFRICESTMIFKKKKKDKNLMVSSAKARGTKCPMACESQSLDLNSGLPDSEACLCFHHTSHLPGKSHSG